ncbi:MULTISPECIES: mechanosensitive ion channel family protein [unclassified Chelatococcus]|uniref:mechanosensitive ion channel family protein n=1 Tax=unclassified Chelatococcus TaxID=2638111 RepID=UPI001BCD2790|nr:MULTISPECIES: mechanosensitive ion channel family protein [unclassified Chelatococcus]MBS7697888.1 mechanosensitive ion channel family protein [Chelatococcus sp. YT9]MBX3558535.1 mechanosensitive ion channel family protein [Chelatococcus sp.]
MTLGAFLASIRETLFWIPDWIYAILLLSCAAGLALLLHRTIKRLLRRLIGPTHPFLQQLVTKTDGPRRMAVVVFAIAVVLPATPLTSAAALTLAKVLLVAFIILVGWSALTAVELACQFHLRRFRIDTDDNLLARKHVTQVNILKRTVSILVVIITTAAALMTFSAVRQYGVSLIASAGAAGLIVGLAARPILANLIAGIQIAITQPIRIDDAVVVEGEWGWIEEITATYVVIKIWDWRRLVVPLSYFIEQPFQNWTRTSGQIIGSVFLYADYTVPVDKLRAKLEEIVKASPFWDGAVVNLQVVEAETETLKLRALVSARTSPRAWDLRCEVREKLLAFLQTEYPRALPRRRAELVQAHGPADDGGASAPRRARAGADGLSVPSGHSPIAATG